MSEDVNLQSLLEKINRDGVDNARVEASKIVDAAKKEAAEIVKAAKADAEKAKADAEKAAADYESRAKETLKQASRDTVLKIEAAITTELKHLLTATVDAALAKPEVLSDLAVSAVKSIVEGGEVVCSSQLAQALAAKLVDRPEFKVTTDETTGAGFKVRVEKGRVEHTFTGDAIADELSRRLRPDLAALLK